MLLIAISIKLLFMQYDALKFIFPIIVMVLQRIWWQPGSEHPTVFLMYNLQAYDTFISYYLYLNLMYCVACFAMSNILLPFPTN